MLYRTSLAILSSGLIAIETFAVSVPLLSVDSDVDVRSILSWKANDQAGCQADEVAADSDEILGMSSAGVAGTISLIQLVAAVAALGRRRTLVEDDETTVYPTSFVS